jgi:hypothetical protein
MIKTLSKIIYFLKRTWFLYVLSKYQGMFKILQWNARLRKTSTLKIAWSSPKKFSIYRSCIKEINIIKIYVLYYGVKPLIHQSELRTYTKVVPFQEKNSFHFVVLWKLLNGMEWLKLIIEVKYIGIIVLKRTWFLYVLSKYQGMFKILQWNARLRKTPTLKIAWSSPKNSVFKDHVLIYILHAHTHMLINIIGVKPLIHQSEPRTYESSPFSRKKFLSVCSIVKTMTRAIWKKPCINIFITYFARADNMLLPYCSMCSL